MELNFVPEREVVQEKDQPESLERDLKILSPDRCIQNHREAEDQ